MHSRVQDTDPSRNWGYKLDVETEAKWDYLVRQDQDTDEPVFLKYVHISCQVSPKDHLCWQILCD